MRFPWQGLDRACLASARAILFVLGGVYVASLERIEIQRRDHSMTKQERKWQARGQRSSEIEYPPITLSSEGTRATP